jgi:hypothetical protein
VTNFPAYVIDVDLPQAESGAPVEFRALRAAVFQAGQFIKAAWLRAADGQVVNRSSGDYIAGLRGAGSLRYPLDGDRFAVGVFNVARHAAVIEDGHPAFNLATAIDWGNTPKSKPTKAGSWYIVIPFRHYTPPRNGEGATVSRFKKSMPAAVHRVAKKLEPGEHMTFRDRESHEKVADVTAGRHGAIKLGERRIGPGGGRYLHVTSAAARSAAFAGRTEVDAGGGKTVIRHPGQIKSPASHRAHVQHWKDTGKDGPEPSAARKAWSIYEGMVKSGSKGHTQYMTFRVITPRSNWWIPARRGLRVAEAVHAQTAPTVRAMFQSAFRQDVERALARALSGAA